MSLSTLTPLTLDTPVCDVLGAEAAERLATVNVTTAADLITYWPRKWRERGQDIDLALVPDGEATTTRVTVTSVKTQPMRNNPRRRFLVATCITPHARTLELSFFSVQKARHDGVKEGAEMTVSGKVKTFRTGGAHPVSRRQMSNPEYTFDEDPSDLAGSIVTVYPATAQAPSPWIARQVRDVLQQLGTLYDPIPDQILIDRELPTYDWAVRQIHVPDSLANAELAKRRLTFDEAFAVQLTLAQRRYGSKATPTRPLPGVKGAALDAFDARLPFTLTPGQQAAGARLAASLNANAPTNALVEGEVGSGKTVVAVRAMLQAVDSGAQCAMVAPTEVLATQHYEGLRSMLEGLDVSVELFTASKASPAERRALEERLATGAIDIVVGTHVLTNGRTRFDNLGLVVVDEQHRFGVAARDALRQQPVPPHMIVMTATPIPRTMAMTVYGDLDLVELEGLPSGREPIQTVVTPTAKPGWVDRVWARVAEEVAAGRQAFLVASLIDPSDRASDADDEAVDTVWADGSTTTTPPLSVVELYAQATARLPGVRVGMLHGRMDPVAKHSTMEKFAAGDLDVLVSTTVIEVGVNVPNATVMAVWDADRFGIAQLHQLRGRVGRGAHRGLCLLVTSTPDDHGSRNRLETVAATLDGHRLAVADLKARREGDILGTGQAGRSAFKLLDLTTGARIISAARHDAEALVKADPALRANRMLARWVADTISREAAANLTRA